MKNSFKTKRKSGIFCFVLLICLASFIQCKENKEYRGPKFGQSTDEMRRSYNGKHAKYVFYFIGDGMGLPQINAAEAYLSAIENDKKIGVKRLNLSTLPAQAFITTFAENRYITGSAAAGTALATGHKTTINTISMDGKRKKKLKTIAEMARDAGKKVGIITTVSIDHATPAAFYAHQPNRRDSYSISIDLANSGFDFFGGGGFKYPAGKKKNKKINSIELAKKNGYRYVDNRKEFNRLTPGDGKVIIVNPNLDDKKAVRYSIDQNDEDITLSEFTSKAIEMLDSEKGFFMMVEGGKIDWACHANDAGAVIHDIIAFDDAVGTALKFYKNHPDETMIVVVADHETGGMTLGFAGMKYESAFDKIKNQKISFEKFGQTIEQFREDNKKKKVHFSDMMAFINKNFGLGDSSKGLELNAREIKLLKESFESSMLGEKIESKNIQTYILYGDYEPLAVTVTHILNQKAGISWTSYSHTGVPVPVHVLGPGEELFRGYYDNTDVPKNIMTVMGLKK